ncbi:MAG: hypothetical protein IPJ83_04155 [Saprospiraceae bacterium]|nr:hypothetical protein [Candidatus Vicinibacter proximus]
MHPKNHGSDSQRDYCLNWDLWDCWEYCLNWDLWEGIFFSFEWIEDVIFLTIVKNTIISISPIPCIPKIMDQTVNGIIV